MKWERLYFFNMVLPFGPRSVPFLFYEFSSALVWIIRNKLNISKVIHILDDFSMPNFTPFDKSNIPIVPGKTFPACTCLELMGILYQIPIKWKPVSRQINSPAFRETLACGLTGNLLLYRSSSLCLAPFNLLLPLASPSCNAPSILQRVSSSLISTFALMQVSVRTLICGNIFQIMSYFGRPSTSLFSSEFTCNRPFDPSVHLSSNDMTGTQ